MATDAHTDLLSPFVPGAFFRHYQLLEQIGVGGQAVVWSALSQNRDRVFAIKFNKVLDSDETTAEEIGIEHKLEMLLKLQHPHILPLHEYGSEERVRFMVTPYIPGGTLATRLRIAALSFDEVLRYGVEIASALDYLHSQGVIHRDLKTSNILLDLSGHTYLADFGLARFVTTSTLAFHTGHGTPPYAPPEQVRSKEITPRSDIFSFGILLFEMLTGQLPWNGKKQLGVEQLHSSQELPDPREYVTGLPPMITDVLRRVTSADPDLRPRSASEVMKMLCYVFGTPVESLQAKTPSDKSAARNRDAQELLQRGLSQWTSTNGKADVGLTKFALIDLHPLKTDTNGFHRFMLSQALTYGYNDDRWWATVKDPREKLAVASLLLEKENESIAARVVRHLVNDRALLGSARRLPKSMIAALLANTLKTKDAVLRQQMFAGVRTFIPARRAWKDDFLNANQSKRLAELALEDSEFGDSAAELIGHLRSPSAVRFILNHVDEGRKIDALLQIQQVAGSLPGFVPQGIRFRLSLEWMLQRLTQQPMNLMGAYLMAFLGAALGIGIQVYMTYNLPDFLDTARVATSLEQGLIIGSMFGLGVFLTRVIVERLQTSGPLLRVAVGTIAGGVVMNIGLLLFHMLFLNTPPSGLLITLGCLLIASTFAVSGLIRLRLVKMLLASLATLTAIIGSWLAHTSLASSSLQWTPLFRYDYTWTLGQVFVTALLVALPIGILGNLVSLAIKDEFS